MRPRGGRVHKKLLSVIETYVWPIARRSVMLSLW
jgi:hypothetical protein